MTLLRYRSPPAYSTPWTQILCVHHVPMFCLSGAATPEGNAGRLRCDQRCATTTRRLRRSISITPPQAVVGRRESSDCRAIELTLLPGASVARVAQAEGVNANQVFWWRRAYRNDELLLSSLYQSWGAAPNLIQAQDAASVNFLCIMRGRLSFRGKGG